ncbi:hypothetical protein VP01_2857g6 [Puccinia sorghi]|uniref:Uncharacterized protein n=1 Tax=Puccinia sorghi TaxID=27349 RepID=A0A0L6V1Y5_9BASI|nr:hypothetical protein VP01_2857g6 [Puccinia sorghi]
MTPEDAATTVRRFSTKGSHTFSSHTTKILVPAFLQKKSRNTFPTFYRLTLGFRKRWNPLMEAQTSLSHSNLPFTYLKNLYFQEYQLELVHSVYKLPRQVQIIEKTLPMVHAQNQISLLDQLNKQSQLTLSLDCWMENAGNKIYALMALKEAKHKYFLDILDLHSKRHMAGKHTSGLKELTPIKTDKL